MKSWFGYLRRINIIGLVQCGAGAACCSPRPKLMGRLSAYPFQTTQLGSPAKPILFSFRFFFFPFYPVATDDIIWGRMQQYSFPFTHPCCQFACPSGIVLDGTQRPPHWPQLTFSMQLLLRQVIPGMKTG